MYTQDINIFAYKHTCILNIYTYLYTEYINIFFSYFVFREENDISENH